MVTYCPYCGKELIDLSIAMVNKGMYRFWCDDCNVEIYITKPNYFVVNENEMDVVKFKEV